MKHSSIEFPVHGVFVLVKQEMKPETRNKRARCRAGDGWGSQTGINIPTACAQISHKKWAWQNKSHANLSKLHLAAS